MKENIGLPDEYTYVPEARLVNKNPIVPKPKNQVTLSDCGDRFQQSSSCEELWVEPVHAALDKQHIERNQAISWSAYHASETVSVGTR